MGTPDNQLFQPLPELSDDELASLISEMAQRLSSRGWSFEGMTGTLRLAFFQAALQEQSRRLLKSSLSEAQAARRSATDFARLSLGLAILAILIATTAGLLNYYSDKDWQHDQTRILTDIRDLLADP